MIIDKNEVINWVKETVIGSGGKGVIVGLSGGKDSTVVAKLCVEALGKDNVVGVLMPNGLDKDYELSKEIAEYLGIRTYTIDIYDSYLTMNSNIIKEIGAISSQTQINIAPRIRMTYLYAIAQTLGHYRVSCNCNFSEILVGYETKWGDNVGDFSPLAYFSVKQVIELGRDLDIPEEYLVKPPIDGLTCKTDEEVLGVTYDDIQRFIDFGGELGGNNEEVDKIIIDKVNKSRHKRDRIPCFLPY